MSRRQEPSPPRVGLAAVARTALLVAVGTLVMLAWLTPAEDAASGDTVPRAIGWLVVAAVWLWLPAVGWDESSSPTTNDRSYWWDSKTRPTLLADVGVAFFVGGHVLSGLIVLATSGQKRFAANLLVEWLGLGCAWIVLRELVRVPAWRSALTALLLAAATAAAGLGIWQHQVTLPQMAREYGPKIAAVREALARGETHPFLRDLAAAGVPTSEPGLTLYEKRLRDSHEPFGMFALANTLGGLLAAALVWGTACLTRTFDRRSPRSWLGGASLLLMAVCLVFTKSRTAAVATVCGLMLVGYRTLRARGWSPGRMLVGGGIAAAGMVAVAAAALALGVWDREVLAEAPKSLGYRWLYWQGTARLIAERPLLGVGLGQFRSEYLRVKLPEASEEIADPHNIVLDAWVNGGLLAVMGLVLCGFSLIFGATMAKSTTEPNASGSWGVVGGGALAHALILTLEPWNDAVLVLGLAWAAAVAVWLPLATTGLGSRAALLTLGIHLLAAGGGGMPAVVLLGLVMLAISVTKVDGDVSREARPIAWKRPLLSWGLAILAVFVAALIWRPDAECRELIAEGDRAAARGVLMQAMARYSDAQNRDRWNPTPAGRLGELQQQKLRDADALSGASKAAVANGVAAEADSAYQVARQRDPANGEWIHELGRCWLSSYELTNEADHAWRAAKWFHQAWQRYPTNAEWAADWAEAAQAAGQFDDARRAAEIALKQDDLNRQLGHVERWLPESRRNELINWKDSPEP